MKARSQKVRFAPLPTLLAFVLCFALKAHGALPVKHIILFIGDGMHLEHEIAASRYLTGRDYALSFHELPYQASVVTWDVTTYDRYAGALGKPSYDPAGISPEVGYDPLKGGLFPYPLQKSGIDEHYFLNPSRATDSASAATALATGCKTEDGNISWLPGDPKEGSLKTIAEMLREEKGFAIGVVSTVPISHATPAAFVSHNTARDHYHEIAEEILKVTKPEVVIGGGCIRHEAGTYVSDKYMPMALYRDMANGALTDYIFVERQPGRDGSAALAGAAQSAAKSGKKLFGLFGGARGNFESPVPADQPENPSVRRATNENPLLSDATLAALKVLTRDPEGFFLMVEQGDIDWANHDNDYAGMVGTVWDLHEAVRAALAYVDRPGDAIDWENTLLIVTADHANSYMRLNENRLPKKGDLPDQRGPVIQMGGKGLRPSYPEGEVTYGSTSHTNELVRLYARGEGVQLFKDYEGAWYKGTAILDNTHVFHVMAAAAGVAREARVIPVR